MGLACCASYSSEGGAQKKKLKKVPPVLVIGTGGSGKSTFCKQMQLIYQTPGSDTTVDSENIKSILLSNIIVGLQERLQLIASNGIELEPENIKRSRFIIDSNPWDMEWTDKLEETVKQLWQDSGVQEIQKQIITFQIQIPHLDYLISNLPQYRDPQYVPTKVDILRARQRTTGANVIHFASDKYCWTMVDLGGQFCEREKWSRFLVDKNNNKDTQNTTENNNNINIEENIGKPCAFIGFIALDEFDVKSREKENPDITKFELSLDVIIKFSQLPECKELCPVLFLNKMDLFVEKLKTEKGFMSFRDAFDFTGTKEESLIFIRNMVTERLAASGVEVNVYITCALDPDLMNTIFTEIQKFFIFKYLFD